MYHKKANLKQRIIDEMTIPIIGEKYKLKNRQKLLAIFRNRKFDLFDCINLLAGNDIIVEGKNYKENLVSGYVDEKLFQLPIEALDLAYTNYAIPETLKTQKDFSKCIIVDYQNKPMAFDGTQLVYVRPNEKLKLKIYLKFEALILINKSITYRLEHFHQEIKNDENDLIYYIIPCELSEKFINEIKN